MDTKINCCSEVGCFCDDISDVFDEFTEDQSESEQSEK